ncbi:MAG TPA: flagellar motor switch protein FliN [Candidatus Baltobacteraceae bacterium]|nr:flagellar motor switch protein FliN [Candidatus Baltobacteraceae bacterium]
MPDIQQLTDAMLEAAGTVLGRLVEQPVAASAATRNDHEGSIKIDADTLVTVAEIPSLAIRVVVRFNVAEIGKIVNLMLGGADDSAEMGAMQLSIVSETVSQIAAAMAEQLAKGVGASSDGVHADLCTDATNLPAPPFASYEGAIQVGAEVAPQIAIDFDGIALGKIGGSQEAEVEAVIAAAMEPVAVAVPAAPKRPQPPTPPAQPVSFASMTPTAQRAAQGGNNLDLVHDVPLQISAVLGKTALTLRDVVTLQSGSVFELDKLSTDPIDLYVNNILIARGEVVVVDDKYAVKISELNPSVE